MQTVEIGNDALSTRIAPYGATMVDLRLDGWPHPLVLGFEREADYVGADHYAGAVIGRFANRIANGRVTIDGRPVQLSVNSGGHHLHGGAEGLSRQVWAIAEQARDSVTLSCVSPDRHEGYPGNCEFRVTYAVVPPASLRLSFTATTDAATFVNLCHHPYFNLAGHGDLCTHWLEIAADRFLWSGEDLVPTGEIREVAGTVYDFTVARRLNRPRPSRGFNNTYYLATETRAEPAFAARLALDDGPAMELWTTQPGLHLYDAYKLADGLAGLEGRRYGPGQGICLEAQGWPNSPAYGHFPQALLRPGETYRQVTEYRVTPATRNGAEGGTAAPGAAR